MKPTFRVIEGNNGPRTADPVGNRIRDFLAGNNDDGRELFTALYGHIGREAIPERLRLAAGLAPVEESVPALVNLAGNETNTRVGALSR
jgi:hypothetical protein